MADNRVRSDVVSNVLDWVGLSDVEVQWRIKVWKQFDSVINVLETIISRKSVRITGSRAEGVGMDVLGSDIDFMACDKSLCLIFSFSEWKLLPGVKTCLVDTTDVHPGYCRLIPMHSDVPTFFNAGDILLYKSVSLESYGGRLVLCNTRVIPSPDIQCYSQQGPARTYHDDIADVDGVDCFHSNWPHGAREWIDRNRLSSYPSNYFVHEAGKKGIEIVAIGHKGSEHSNTEWRFSFSFTELDLVHMWPNTVLKCYVLLKLLKNSITSRSPHLCHTLSSYHLKTLLFWLTEETGLEYWNAQSLMHCLMFSLKKLLRWTEDGCIPHYFIRSNNLFDNDVGTSRQKQLITVIRAMVIEGPTCLLRCESYNHWYREMIETCPSHHSYYVIRERSFFHVQFTLVLNGTFLRLTQNLRSTNITTHIVDIVDVKNKLTALTVQYLCDNCVCEGIRNIVDVLGSLCSSLMLSFSQQSKVSNVTRFRLFIIAERILAKPKDKFVKMKLANFYYQIGHYKQAIDVLLNLTEMSQRRTIKIALFGLSRLTIADMQYIATIDSPFSVYSKMVLPVPIFVYPEICVIPHALKFEMFKSEATVSNVFEETRSRHIKSTVVDPEVFVYYMCYLCYCQLKKHSHAQAALSNLQSIVKEENVIHKETALNLLGHCYMERNQLRQAATYFVKSLKVQRNFSVASLHLAVLISKAIKQRL